jgi:hypothetical protein
MGAVGHSAQSAPEGAVDKENCERKGPALSGDVECTKRPLGMCVRQ